MRCRDDLRCARTAARHRVGKQLLRHGRIFRDGKTQWTQLHRAWIAAPAPRRPRSRTPRSSRCSSTSTGSTARSMRSTPSSSRSPAASGGRDRSQILTRFRGIATRTALGLIAEIGDFARFSHPRELASWLGIVPSEYSSGDQQHRGHITKAGNRHARRLLIEAAWHYRHPPRRPAAAPNPTSAPGKRRSACTTATATSPSTASARTVANVADRPRARRLPLGRDDRPAADHHRPAAEEVAA